jgi:DNA damage-binding protein 1
MILLQDMSNITAFRNPSFENCIAFTTSSGVMVGQIDQVQKLHINKIPLGEMARRICYQESTRTFAIITTKMETSLSDSSKDSSIKILDDQSFESKSK